MQHCWFSDDFNASPNFFVFFKSLQKSISNEFMENLEIIQKKMDTRESQTLKYGCDYFRNEVI